ncbi:MAG: exodeoxyribonuclease III [Candidatus Marinimicrobia bacterium]|nr:exodeoxyribonuclease III [Candidatus Neomarinimicrobiota bacterium]
MKIISWNVNGLRALHKKGLFLDFIKKEKPDVLCLQETKASEDQLSEDILKVNGYSSFFSSSKNKKGYSGVAIYSRTVPIKVEYGMSINKFDEEGRMIIAHYSDFVLLNVYFPNGGQGPERLSYKMEFYKEFLKFVKKLKKNGKNIIFCGDVNTAHKEIDLARPKPNETKTGFLPEERAWIDEVVKSGFVDVFRYFNPTKAGQYTYWDLKSRARDRNVGWRIDYFFTNKDFVGKIKSTSILSEVYGSDHCPTAITIAV